MHCLAGEKQQKEVWKIMHAFYSSQSVYFGLFLISEIAFRVPGITFSKTGVKMDKRFVAAHLLSETRYMIPTFTGIPLKISSKVSAAVKGRVMVDIKAQPELINSKFENLESTVIVKPE